VYLFYVECKNCLKKKLGENFGVVPKKGKNSFLKTKQKVQKKEVKTVFSRCSKKKVRTRWSLFLAPNVSKTKHIKGKNSFLYTNHILHHLLEMLL
jgi:hypothetical protein